MTLSATRVYWTVPDLEGLPENGNRYEIIDGELFMTRAPHWDHQEVASAICSELRIWSRESGLGRAVFEPGILFSDTDNVIPDVVWVSNERLKQLLDEEGHLVGAPELVVEVLSLSEKDKKRDRETKLKLYSIQGVREYWIADREQKAIEVYRRQQGILVKVMTLFEGDDLTSLLLPEFSCEVKRIFN